MIKLAFALMTLFEFPEQTTLPLTFSLKGDLLEGAIEGDVTIKQNFYAKVEGEELFFSTDQVEWKPFLDFFTGSISTFFSPLAIEVEANRRP